MRKYDFESIVYRKGTSSYKTNAEVIKTMFDLNYYDDTISMWVADMDFACPPEVIDAIKKRADRKIFGYTGESSEYHKSIIDWYKRRHDMDIEEEWLVFSNGTVIPTILRETSGLKKIRVSFWKSVRKIT